MMNARLNSNIKIFKTLAVSLTFGACSFSVKGLGPNGDTTPLTSIIDGTPLAQSTVIEANAWKNISFALPVDTKVFSAEFKVKVDSAPGDTVLGFSETGVHDAMAVQQPNAVSNYQKLAAIVRFNNSGAIDARNGAAYESAHPLSYNSSETYFVNMDIDLTQHIYNVKVQSTSQSAPVEIAANFAFRSEQASVQSLKFLSILSSTGRVTFSGLSFKNANGSLIAANPVLVTDPMINPPSGNTKPPVIVTPAPPEGDSCPNGSASSITQYGITWTFNKSYPCGHFVNGDYWVKGPIVIQTISPLPANGANGFDINPTSFSANGFAYDNRIAGYTAANAPQTLPRTVGVSSSVVSTISCGTPDRVGDPKYGSQQFFNSPFGGDSRSTVHDAAVLTVLAAIPNDGQNGATFFRPAYMGTDKTLISAKNIRSDKLLSLAPVGGTPSIDWVARKFSRVQLDHNSSYLGAYMHPVNNMNNYGGTLTIDAANAILRLSLNDSVAAKLPLLIGFTQSGIDHFAMVKGGTYYTGDGGHFSGRKIQILFAGLMLDNSEMMNIGKTSGEFLFAEDCQTFYTTENPPEGFYSKLDSKYGPNFARYEIKHCSPGDRPVMLAQERIGEELGDGSTYWGVNFPSWIGEALAIHLYGLKGLWNHNAFPELMDRAVQTQGVGRGGYNDGFNNSMWATYRNQ